MNLDNFVCTSEDDYVRELQDVGQTIWVARLSNQQTIYMDDHRPGLHYSAWVRLGQYCRANNLRIFELYLKFRSVTKQYILPLEADAYFFSKSVGGMFGCDDTFRFYLVGALYQGKLSVQKWAVPELILMETQDRDPAKAGVCLI